MLLVSEQLLRGEGGETFHILIFIDYFHFKLPCSFICPVSVQVSKMRVKYRIQTRMLFIHRYPILKINTECTHAFAKGRGENNPKKGVNHEK